MTNKKSTKKALLASVLSMMVCVVMLIGTTFAWFTDSVTSANNRIQAGNLKIDLLMDKEENGTYASIATTTGDIFNIADKAQNSNNTLWEPNKTQVVYLAIENKGSLDVKYKVTLDVTNGNTSEKPLTDVLEYAITPDATADNKVTTWDETAGKTVVAGKQEVAADVFLKAKTTHYFALSVHMLATAGNEYQNGTVSFDMRVDAAQVNSESDSFGSSYDMYAEYEEPSSSTTVAAGTKEDLMTAFAALNTTDVVNITKDIDLAGVDWEPIDLGGYGTGGTGRTITINGNGHKILNMTCTDNNAGLVGSAWLGGTKVIFNDLTIEKANLKCETTADPTTDGCGAFLATLDAAGSVEFNNCHVVDSVLESTGTGYAGGLIGYNSSSVGGSCKVNDCSVTGTKITAADGSVGSIVGHSGPITVDGFVATGNTITHGDEGRTSAAKAGIYAGTINKGTSVLTNVSNSGCTIDADGTWALSGKEVGRVVNAGVSVTINGTTYNGQ